MVKRLGRVATRDADLGDNVVVSRVIAADGVTAPDVKSGEIYATKLRSAYGTTGPVSDALQTWSHNLGADPTIYGAQGLSGAVLPGDIILVNVNQSQLTYKCSVSGGYVRYFALA